MPISLRRRTPKEAFNQTPTDSPVPAPLPSLKVLSVSLMHDERPDHRLSASIALTFETPAGPQETTASISWETMAQVRSILARKGETISDLEILEKVLLPWTVEQVDLSWQNTGSLPKDNVLEFGDAPRPFAAIELLTRYGFLAG